MIVCTFVTLCFLVDVFVLMIELNGPICHAVSRAILQLDVHFPTGTAAKVISQITNWQTILNYDEDEDLPDGEWEGIRRADILSVMCGLDDLSVLMPNWKPNDACRRITHMWSKS